MFFRIRTLLRCTRSRSANIRSERRAASPKIGASDRSRTSANNSDFISRMVCIHLAELQSKGFFQIGPAFASVTSHATCCLFVWLVGWFQSHVFTLFPGSAAKSWKPPNTRLLHTCAATYKSSGFAVRQRQAFTETDRTRLQNIMGCKGGMTDDDPACPSASVFRIRPTRLGGSSSLTASLPGALHLLTRFSRSLQPLVSFFFHFAGSLFHLAGGLPLLCLSAAFLFRF